MSNSLGILISELQPTKNISFPSIESIIIFPDLLSLYIKNFVFTILLGKYSLTIVELYIVSLIENTTLSTILDFISSITSKLLISRYKAPF